jgi:putative transposase
MAHPPRIPVWLAPENSVVYFITLCSKDRKPVLANFAAFNAFKNAASKIKRWNVIAAILMPDHLHVLVWPATREEPVGDFSALLKHWMRQEAKAAWEWQPGCFDHLLRSEESALEKWLYMRENPVRDGLVKEWHEWPYAIGFEKSGEIPLSL